MTEPQNTPTAKDLRAQARADKAAAKAARPWPMRHKFLTGLGVLIIIGIIAGVAGSGGGSSSDNSTPAAPDGASQVTDSPTATATAPPPVAPKTLLDITGTGTKTTQKFTTGGDWDMAWSYDCSNFGQAGNFIVGPMGENNTPSLANQAVNQLGESGKDVEHYHHGGTYYLSINSECNWHVTVTG